MRKMREWAALRLLIAGALGVVIVAAVAVTASANPSREPPKPTPPITGGIPNDRAIAVAKDVHARNAKYLTDFVAAGRDPRTLRRASMEGFGPAAPTLRDAVQQATLVIHGTVASVQFSPNPSGGLPIARSVVTVHEVLKGRRAEAVSLLQLGGPIPDETDGVLAYLEFDELVLPGDEAFFLLRDRPDMGAHQALPSTGIYFVRNGRVYAEQANYHFGAAVAGQVVRDFKVLLRQASAP